MCQRGIKETWGGDGRRAATSLAPPLPPDFFVERHPPASSHLSALHLVAGSAHDDAGAHVLVLAGGSRGQAEAWGITETKLA